MKPLKELLKKIIEDTRKKAQDKPIPLHKSLNKNLELIRDYLGDTSDMIIREFTLEKNIKCAAIIIDGLTNATYIYDFLLKTIMIESSNKEKQINSEHELYELLKQRIIPFIELSEVENFNSILDGLMVGKATLLIDGIAKGFNIEARGWKDRGVTEATSQTVVRGPKDSFNETLRTNTMLIRRRIKDENLRIDNKKIGRRTKTDVSILYIKGIANQKIVDEVHERLDRIDIDSILESSYIQALIRDNPYSPFPTIIDTERPDSAAASLLNGYVAIIVDGSPYALVVPGLFPSFFQTPEDYYQRYYFATFVRFLRYFSFLITLLTPSFYIAITTFHPEMLPTPLLISISNQREGIPFPAFIEALLMEITFEILREAGIRMPRAVGNAVTVVGGLVLGEAAVQAGIVSNVMVIIVSLTAISSLIAPNYSLGITVRILRFGFMILSATFGLYGITIGMMFLLLHLCSIRSFGVPYLYPFAPFNLEDQRDSFLKFPLWANPKRPNLVSKKDNTRQTKPKLTKPKPPKDDTEINRNGRM